MELIQVISNYLNATNAAIQQEASKQLELLTSDPNILQQFILILANREVSRDIRYGVAVFLKQVIINHESMYVQNPSVFNGLLNLILNEVDIPISDNIAYSLVPIYQRYGENWQEMVLLINQMFASQNQNTVIIGTIFLSYFLPNTKLEYLRAMHPIIINILKQILSTNSDIIEYGFKLFEAVQRKNDPNPQVFGEYSQIFDQMLLLYRQYLLASPNINLIGILSQCISHSVKKEVPFNSPSNFFNALIQIASDPNILMGKKSYSLFPIKSLIKVHGNELKSLIPNAIPLFLTIYAGQFENSDFESEDTSIMALFAKIAVVLDGDIFFNLLLNLISKDANPATSFASLCAIYGVMEELLEQFEQNIEIIVKYIFSKLSIQSQPVIEVCLVILHDLVTDLPTAIDQFSNQILQLCFQLAVTPNYDISKKAILVISNIFQNVNSLETSFVLSNLTNLKQFYIQSASLKPEIMTAIASAIYSCGEDIRPYVNVVVDIIAQGIQSNDILIITSSIEALGNLMALAPEQIQGLYQNGIEFMLQHSLDQDLNIREVCIESLTNIIKSTTEFKSGNENIASFLPMLWTIAISSIGIAESEEDFDPSKVTPRTIKRSGFTLLKALLKYHPQTCLPNFLRTLPITFQDHINYQFKDVAIKAIQGSVYFLLNCQPPQTNLFEIYINIIQENKSKDRCRAVFKAYLKLIESKYNPAISVIVTFMQCVIAALKRMLFCQRRKCISEETRFSFDPDFMEPVYSILCESFKINISIIPPNELLQLMGSLLNKVTEVESYEILGTLGDYILAGGSVNNEIIQFAYSKLGAVDYSKGPDAIYFLRTLIRKNPQIMAQMVPNLLNFCVTHLQSEVSDKQYYWHTMMNIISTLFDISMSQPLSGMAPMNQVMPLILKKLPVNGDMDEADFIYSSLINYFQQNQNEIGANLANLFIVLIQTLSTKKSSFQEFNLQDQTVSGLINLTKLILNSQPNLQQEIPGILKNDEIRINRLKERLNIA